MYAQCNPDGEQFILLKAIRDHKQTSKAIPKAEAYVTVNGKPCPLKTTKGWLLCIEWKDGTTKWEHLVSDMKESFPVDVTEYTISAGIQDKPAFNWWVKHVINKQNRIVSKVNS